MNKFLIIYKTSNDVESISTFIIIANTFSEAELKFFRVQKENVGIMQITIVS